ncbi:hypothetical protein SAMN05444279_103202 [Ruegeria intermedia]|uniref:Acyltransferase family protein n=1 Tax=Ruegeria intermedia TaxID=996115 RepID=A0A1M4U694_9RHOB|nr:hypothetical protein [Ruegeria intermedia]SHE52361.1 hypothetical protein SAMN05444279_103202 [Ruegeria intermedia]
MNQYLCPDFHLPWALNVVAMALPIVWLGHQWRRYQAGWSLGLAAWVPLLIFGVGYLTAAWFEMSPQMRMKRADYGWPLITLGAAVAVTILLGFTSKQITRIPVGAKLFGVFGTASMTIMYIHQPIQLAMKDMGLASDYLRLPITLGLSLAVHHMLNRTQLTQRLFLGRTRSGAPGTSAAS